eukprot:TRINITY_DN7668_c1_g2_i1.p1 TRINITY_DN7668_c1_g2~~TRINITY_DN7668_c1_g2_i1.p1  ORF type:complete len:367 (+),score=74.24 TRINITY_DN7668_c1_g2_i1:101-1201(+)
MAVESCWVGTFTFDFCCQGQWGIGFKDCWDGHYTWDKCCKDELIELMRKGEATEETPQVGSQLPVAILAKYQETQRCIEEYDSQENSRWFLRHTALMAHHMAHVGNPRDCTAGGHRFFWGFVIIVQQETGQDIPLEYGICVPKSCSFQMVETIFVPFTFGRYLAKPWGPQPEILNRWVLTAWEGTGKSETVEDPTKLKYFIYEILQKHEGGMDRFYKDQWPFRGGCWEYMPTWRPSEENSKILAALSLPSLFAAGVVMIIGRSRPSENRVKAAEVANVGPSAGTEESSSNGNSNSNNSNNSNSSSSNGNSSSNSNSNNSSKGVSGSSSSNSNKSKSNSNRNSNNNNSSEPTGTNSNRRNTIAAATQ